jgi:hypothetical protein
MSELTEALEAFPRWMNRPTKRAQVYTFRRAVAMFGNDTTSLFRARPAYRNATARAQRQAVATATRLDRGWGKAKLPRYDERSGEYV